MTECFSLSFTAGHIHSDIDVWGNRQAFNFDQHQSSLTLKNTFAPDQNTTAILNLEWMNSQSSGFRLQHETVLGDTFGSLELSTFLNGQNTGTPFLDIDYTGFAFHVKARGLEPTVPSDFSTKNYVDITSVKSVTAGTGLYGGTIDAPYHQYGTIGIADVGITPGLYTWPTALNINAQGQVYGASSGPQPIHLLIPGQGMNINQNAGTAYLSLQDSGVQPGWYTRMSGYVDIMGRVLTVANGEPPDLNTETIGDLAPQRIENYPSDNSVFLRGDGLWAAIEQAPADLTTATGELAPQKIELYPSDDNVFLRGDGLWERPIINNLYITGDVGFANNNIADINGVFANYVQADVMSVGDSINLGTGVAIQSWPGFFKLQQTDPLHSDILIPNRQIHIIFNGQLVAIPCNIL